MQTAEAADLFATMEKKSDKEERPSFLKKRSKKLFCLGATHLDLRSPGRKSFLLLFFKKEVLAFFACPRSSSITRRPRTGSTPTLERLLPPEIFAEAAPSLHRFGQRCVDELPPLAERAEQMPPRHVPYDAWGARMRRRSLAEAWLDNLSGRLARATHPELEWVKPRIADALGAMRPMVLEPDEREGRRIAGGMARRTHATLLMEAAAWRIVAKDNGSALIATEMITREPQIPAKTADMDLHALAYADAGAT